MFKNVLFDLDGTLTDSREGIINGFIYGLKSIGIEENDRKSIEKYIGPPFDRTKRYKTILLFLKWVYDRRYKDNKIRNYKIRSW